VILGDAETGSHWDHFTGEAFDGPLLGSRLEVWPVAMTTVGAALHAAPQLRLYRSPLRSFQKWLAMRLYPHFIQGKVWLPPPFLRTMSGPVDPRLDRLTQGLGVVVGGRACFYPLGAIPPQGFEDDWNGRTLRLTLGQIDRVPRAEWQDGDAPPMQLLTRWYGFSFTYPGCRIFPITP
jgi:hypothetical protein